MSVNIKDHLMLEVSEQFKKDWGISLHQKAKREKYKGPIWVLGSPDNFNSKYKKNGDSEHKLIIIYKYSKFRGNNFECYFSLDWRDRKIKYFPTKNPSLGLDYLHKLAAKRLKTHSDIVHMYIAGSRKSDAIKEVFYFKESAWIPYADYQRKIEKHKETISPSLLRMWICYKPIWQTIRKDKGLKPNQTIFPADTNSTGRGYHVALLGLKEWVSKNRINVNTCVQKLCIYRSKDGKHVANIYENGSVYFIDKEFEKMVENRIYLPKN